MSLAPRTSPITTNRCWQRSRMAGNSAAWHSRATPPMCRRWATWLARKSRAAAITKASSLELIDREDDDSSCWDKNRQRGGATSIRGAKRGMESFAVFEVKRKSISAICLTCHFATCLSPVTRFCWGTSGAEESVVDAIRRRELPLRNLLISPMTLVARRSPPQGWPK